MDFEKEEDAQKLKTARTVSIQGVRLTVDEKVSLFVCMKYTTFVMQRPYHEFWSLFSLDCYYCCWAGFKVKSQVSFNRELFLKRRLLHRSKLWPTPNSKTCASFFVLWDRRLYFVLMCSLRIKKERFLEYLALLHFSFAFNSKLIQFYHENDYFFKLPYFPHYEAQVKALHFHKNRPCALSSGGA